MRLSDRDRMIAEMIMAGASNKDIAARLNMRLPTVQSYVRRLYLKFDVESYDGNPRVLLAMKLRDYFEAERGGRGAGNQQASRT
jgi:DNA-binding NarL/FixJ family response regulator